jgi:hypothetical protein
VRTLSPVCADAQVLYVFELALNEPPVDERKKKQASYPFIRSSNK